MNIDSVKHESAEYTAWMEDSELVRTLLKGTKGMKAAGVDYLPQHPFESAAAYAVRLENTALLNAFRKTVSFLGGQVFQRDIIFDDTVPEEFVELSKDIDTAGNNLNVFAKRVFNNGIGRGVSLIFIDSPVTEEGLTVADEREAGVRPYFKEIHPENLIGYQVDDDGFLTQVRIKEFVTTQVGKYAQGVKESVRVLMVGSWELYDIDGKGGETLVDSGSFNQDVLPLVAFIPGKEQGQLRGESPLIDLGELNLSHWRSTSAQTNILNVGRIPLLFGKMIDLDALPVGSSMINSNDEDADLRYVEITGAAIAAGQTDLTETEAKMALWGLQQLIPRTGAQTATEKNLTSAESNSALGTWATEFQDILNHAFRIMAGYTSQEFPADGLTCNKEYNFGVADPAELTAILKAQEQGVTSARGAFDEFRRRGTFTEHSTYDDVQADIEQEERDRTDELGDLAGTAFGSDE